MPPAPSALAGSLRQTDPASVSESQDDTGDTGDQSEAGMPGADQSADPGPGLGITFPCDRGLELRLPLGDSDAVCPSRAVGGCRDYICNDMRVISSDG